MVKRPLPFQVRSSGPVGVVYSASVSSSMIVPRPKLSTIFRPPGLERLTTKVSSASIRESLAMGTSMTFLYSPSANVNVPLTAVKSSADALPPKKVE